mgnify:CR=1 FL=1
MQAIENGIIKGVVGLVSCTNILSGHDYTTINFLKELLSRDILVLVAGCASSAAQIEGFMNLSAIEKYAGPGLKNICRSLNIPPALNFGSCVDTGRIILLVTAIANHLKVDPSQLPVAACCPEYYNNDALVDGLFAVAMGITTFVSPMLPIAGAPGVIKLLTKDLENSLGAKFILEQNLAQAIKLLEMHLENKCRKL